MQEYITTTQFSKKYHVSKSYLYRLIKQGQCPGYHSGNRFYISVDTLLAQMNMTQKERNNMTS